MSDIRRCDGPDCDVAASLDSDVPIVRYLAAEDFITLTRPRPMPDKHFHQQSCLTKWVQENTKGDSGRGN